jgi:hypothetical protein
MLDGDGICRYVVGAAQRRSSTQRESGPLPSHAERCIGAQYVASIALGAKGGLIEMPRQGAPMLFARIEANGRIALVRTGFLVRLEELGASGVRRAPADSEPDTDVLDRALDSFIANIPQGSQAGRDDEERTTPYRVSHMRAARPGAPASVMRAPTPLRVPAMSLAEDAPPIAGYGRSSAPPPRASMRVQKVQPAPVAAPPQVPAGPMRPRRPSVVRVTAPSWDAEATPRVRKAR